MDYEALLRKYMAHVIDYEGCDYIDYSPPREVKFTPEEWAKLREIAEDISPPPKLLPLQLMRTQVFIDGKEVMARAITSYQTPSGGACMTIDAEGLPMDGLHQLRVIFPDGRSMGLECRVDIEHGEPRFYPIDAGKSC